MFYGSISATRWKIVARASSLIACFHLASFHKLCQAELDPRGSACGPAKTACSGSGRFGAAPPLPSTWLGTEVRSNSPRNRSRLPGRSPASTTSTSLNPERVRLPRVGTGCKTVAYALLSIGKKASLTTKRKRGASGSSILRSLRGMVRRRTYRLANKKAVDFAFVGGTGAAFLDMLGEAQPKQMAVEKRDGGWSLKQHATDFRNWMVRLSLVDDKDKSAAFVVFDMGEDPRLKAISIYPDIKKLPGYSFWRRLKVFGLILTGKHCCSRSNKK